MADEMPSLHIDTHWKKQAQEEKRRLAEAAAKAPAAPAPPLAPQSMAAAAGAAPAKRGRSRELPTASFASLVQGIMTQVLYHLGDLASTTGTGALDLDLARHHLDSLNVLDEKSKNNLLPDEQTILDTALYETRTRFVAVASQLLGP